MNNGEYSQMADNETREILHAIEKQGEKTSDTLDKLGQKLIDVTHILGQLTTAIKYCYGTDRHKDNQHDYDCQHCHNKNGGTQWQMFAIMVTLLVAGFGLLYQNDTNLRHEFIQTVSSVENVLSTSTELKVVKNTDKLNTYIKDQAERDKAQSELFQEKLHGIEEKMNLMSKDISVLMTNSVNNNTLAAETKGRIDETIIHLREEINTLKENK